MKFNSFNKLCFFVLVLFHIISFKTHSQVYTTTASSNFSCFAGMTTSDILNDSISYSPGILFSAGFIYDVRLSKKININIELLYTGKGVKTEAPIVKYRYYYIDLPLYLQFNINDNIRINAGGQYSVFTNSSFTFIDGTNPNGVNTKKHNKIKTSDMGFLFGAEIDVNENLGLTTRYTLSASRFFSQNNVSFGVFTLGLKYKMYSTYKQFFTKKEQAIGD